MKVLIAVLALLATFAAAQEKKKAPTGYTDTPSISGSKWRVHDDTRPRPPVITPGTFSSDERPGRPPSDAVVLFDGTDLSKWQGTKGEPARWKVENGYVEAVANTGDIQSKQEFGDCQLHVEWRVPAPPKGDSQERGNSGVFLIDRKSVV